MINYSHMKVLLKAVDNESEDVGFAAVLHPNATEAVLLKAMNHPLSNARLRAAAVNNNNATEKILQLGLKDNHYHVRKAVVDNPNTPAHILKQASNDEERIIRAIADNRLEQMKKLP